jgi:hypothetical protein
MKSFGAAAAEAGRCARQGGDDMRAKRLSIAKQIL